MDASDSSLYAWTRKSPAEMDALRPSLNDQVWFSQICFVSKTKELYVVFLPLPLSPLVPLLFVLPTLIMFAQLLGAQR